MSSATSDWPFDQPKNVACITLWNILRDHAPVLLVTHDADDGSWQFLDGSDLVNAKPAVVGLANMVKLDPTLLELADLPEGWRAWRSACGAPWTREKKSD